MTSDEQGTPDWGVTEAGGGSGSSAGAPAPDGQSGPAWDAAAGNAATTGAGATGAGAAPGDGAGPEPGAESDQDAAPEPGGRRRRRRRRSFWRELPVLVVVALVIALLIKTFVVQAFWIPSSSMEDTLLIGDKVLVNKLIYHFRKIEPGDIIVFDGAGSWDPVPPPSRPSSDPIVRLYDATLGPLFHSIAGLFGTVPGQTDYIKRVIGTPGDHVACCTAHGLVTVNGVPLHEQSYLFPGAAPSQLRFHITVPPGRLWVMGDNRAVSDDSRLHQDDPGHGTIPESAVIGRAFLIVWPPSRWRVLSIPATFGQPGIDSPKPGSAAARAVEEAALARGIPVAATGTYLPLAAGFVAAVPLTWLQRRIRRRARRRHGRR